MRLLQIPYIIQLYTFALSNIRLYVCLERWHSKQLRALDILVEDLGLFPYGSSQPPVTPVPGDQTQASAVTRQKHDAQTYMQAEYSYT